MQFEDTKTYVNLARSFAGEAQAGMRYQLAARLATQAGYATLADTIRQVRETESRRCQISAVSISRAKRTGSYHMMTPQNQVYIIQFCE